MLRPLILSSALLVAAAGSAAAQAGAPDGPNSENIIRSETPPADVIPSATAAVGKLGIEQVAGRYQALADRMYPAWKERAVKRAGSEEAFQAGVQKMAREMQQSGIIILSSKPSPTAAPVVADVAVGKKETMVGGTKVETPVYTKWLVIVPTLTRIKMMVNGQQQVIEVSGSQIAISDKGKNDWTFIDGSTATVGDLRVLFPTLPSTVKIPQGSKRTLAPGE